MQTHNITGTDLYNATSDSTWATSHLRNFLNTVFLDGGTVKRKYVDTGGNIQYEDVNVISAFTESEKSGLLLDYLPDADTSDKVFILSEEDIKNTRAFPTTTSRISINSQYSSRKKETTIAGTPDFWITRSIGFGDGDLTWVDKDGSIKYNKDVTFENLGVRPSVRLDKSKILMISAINNGKAPGPVLNGAGDAVILDQAAVPTGDMKLTISGNELSLNTNLDLTTLVQDKVTFDYSNASTGANRYLSVVLEKDDILQYYGKLVDMSTAPTNGTVSIDLTGVPAGTYQMEVFVEEIHSENGGKVTDKASPISKTSLTISNNPAQAPSFTTPSNLPNATQGLDYSSKNVVIETTGNPPPIISVDTSQLPAGISVDSNGKVTGTPTVSGTFSFLVTATNSATYAVSTQTYTIEVEPTGTPSFTNGPVLTTAYQGQAYSGAVIFEGVPTPTISLALAAGESLPLGLSFGADGTITGTPTTLGDYSFTVRIHNIVGTEFKTYSIKVEDPNQPMEPVIVTEQSDLLDAAVGSPYSHTFVATGYPTPTFSLTGNLPVGDFSIDPITGVLSGTPSSGTGHGRFINSQQR